MTVAVLYGSGGSPAALEDYTLQGVQIDRGRQDFTSAVSSNRASFQLVYDSSLGTVDPTTLELGEFVEIQYFTPAGFALFGGLITDLSFDKDVVRITAVSDGLSRLGRGNIPSITGFANVFWLAFTGLYTNYLLPLYPPGRYPTIVVGQDQTPVTIPTLTNASGASVLATLCASAPNGFLFEGLSGQLTFYDQSFFRPSTWPAGWPIAVNANEIVDDWQMTKTIGQKVNSAQVTYTSGTVTETDTYDVGLFGLFESSTTTYQTNAADAQNLADRQVANFTDPGWQISAITIPVHTLTAARQNVIVGSIQVGTVIDIPELYTGLPTRYVVQGITDRLGQTLFERTLYLADWELFRPAQTWDDVPAGVDWTEVDPALTWDEMITDWIS